MAVTTKKLFPATSNATTTVFSPVGIQLNNQDDLDVYVTLSGGTRVLQLRQSTGSTAQSSHPQVNNTDGLYFPAVSAGTTLYNYTLSSDNNTITFNSALPSGAVVFCERRTRDADSSYTSFASGSTIRATDLNNSSTESNFTAQDARNKAFDLEGKLFNGSADGSIKTKLDGIEANATQDQTASEIRALVESASDSNVFTDADHSKLNGIEASATADQTNSEIKTAYEANSNTNAYTDAEKTKLSGIETSATADQTGAEIKTAYEGEANTNAFTDAEKTKLSGIATGADVTSSNSVGALNDVDLTGVADNKILKYQASSSKFVIADDTGGGGGSSTFTGLSDSPTNYTGAAGKTLKVNSAGNAIEFVTVATDVVDDTTPQLGGNLDVQASEITTSTTNGNIKLTPDGTGKVEIKGNGSNDAQIVLNCGNNSHGQTIKAPPHSAGVTNTFTLPATNISTLGSAGAAIRVNQSGELLFDTNSRYVVGQDISVTAAGKGIRLGQGNVIEFDSDNTNTEHISFKGPNSLTKTSDFTLPEDGSAGQFLKTDGSGVLSFGTVFTDLVGDTSPQLGGNLDTNGNNISWGDAETANFGDNTDLQIYHSTDNIIKNAQTGKSLKIISANNNVAAVFEDNASVELYEAGSKKLETSSTGITVTGTVVATSYTGDGSNLTGISTSPTADTGGAIFQNSQTISASHTIPTGSNGMSAGPVTINNGVTLTISTGSAYTIV